MGGSSRRAGAEAFEVRVSFSFRQVMKVVLGTPERV